ncbi:hATC-domain-containing protein, partial [Sistotremastrum suecicum HHB10207 ss-3]
AWGGAKEQAAERAKGNKHAKNWLLEAETIVKSTVRTTVEPDHVTVPTAVPNYDALDYDELRRRQLLAEDNDEGWEGEYQRYNKELAREVQRDTDLVKWWFDNSQRYPILARIALDVLPVQASSVACERLFSSAKLTATDLRSRLGTDEFEQLQLLKFAWKREMFDMAKENERYEEEVLVDEEFYQGLEALDSVAKI